MRHKNYLILAILIIFALSLSACSFPWQKKKTNIISPPESGQDILDNSVEETEVQASGEIKKFKDLEDLQAFLIKNSTEASGLSIGKNIKTSNLGAKELAVDSGAVLAGNVTSEDYSTTNLQVAGVDEADIMKTDGNYVYLLDYNDLYIVNAKPFELASVITKITFKSRPQEFYISGDRLVVFGEDTNIYNDKTYQSFKRRSSYVYLKIFDVSDPKNPKQIKDLNLEGSYSSSRLIGDYLYFVTNNYQNYLAGEPVLPRVFDGGKLLPEKCSLSSKCYAPEVFYFDVPYDNFNFTSVMALNIKSVNEALSGDVYLLSGNQNMYVSPNNIYITYTEYLNEYEIERDLTINLIKSRLSTSSQEKVAKIESADSFILSTAEKQEKIYSLIQNYLNNLNSTEQNTINKEIEELLKKTFSERLKEMEKTVIHKIAFSGNKLEYKDSGSVSGHILNQFAMDEQDGYFRIATTRSSSWSKYLEEQSQESYSNVFVLNDKMETIGTLENLAPGERIYSVRFMGNRAYLVTYKQVDPLFAIDLADPKNPRVLGELKIPGYSNYLHPYSENILIGFGRDTEVNSSGTSINKGLKISLFDVSVPSNPKELDNFITGDRFSDSIALYDHKAFLASKSKNLLSLPVVLRNGAYGENLEFSGALVFGLNDNKITLRGRIDHSDSGNYTNKDFWGGFNYFDNSVKRSLYIEDALFTFSNKYLKINDLRSDKDLESIKIIDLLPNLERVEVKPVVPVPSPLPLPLETNTPSSSSAVDIDAPEDSLPGEIIDVVDDVRSEQ